MQQLEIIAFVTSLVSLQIAMGLYIWGFISATLGRRPSGNNASRFAMPVLLLSWLALTITLTAHAIQAGHIPATDMFEFSLSFGWGILTVILVFRWRQNNDMISAAGALVTLAMLVYAFTLPVQHQPLPPALSQTWLLNIHVSCAVIAYGLFALAFICSGLYLARRRYAVSLMPSDQTLDSLGYRSALAGFCFLTVVIIVGSIWAATAWGSYWSWDPKEIAAFVTWLIYGGYLIMRLAFKWRDNRSAWFLVVGFLAVLITFFGNYFFGGLHSYTTQ